MQMISQEREQDLESNLRFRAEILQQFFIMSYYKELIVQLAES